MHYNNPQKNCKSHPIRLTVSNKNAADRNRTGTGITTHRILSPGRLPVPPLRHITILNCYEWDLQGSNL